MRVEQSPAARVVWLMCAVPLVVGAVLSFIASGLIARNDRTMAILVMCGLMSGAWGFFAISRSLSRFKRGFWRDVARPWIFVTGLASAGSSGVAAGLLAQSEMALFGCISGVILCAVIGLFVWLIPVGPWQPPTLTPEQQTQRDRRRARWMLGLGISCFCWIAMSTPILTKVTSRNVQELVIPAVEIPALAIGITLSVLGGMRLAAISRREEKARLSLPLRRAFETDTMEDLDRVVQRHFQSVGYKLESHENALWTFTRGQWHSQLWQEDIRQWRTTLNVAAYELYDGGGRVTCYVDVDRKFGDPKPEQLAILNAELDELREALEADDITQAV
jgi:hypothetical protein